jgi:hypothetical protein
VSIVPPKQSPALVPAIVALIPLYALRVFIVNPFLAFTTVFPFVILMYGTSFQGMYVATLRFLLHLFFGTTLEGATDGNLLTLFFAFVFALTLLLSLIERLCKHIGISFRIDWRHVVAVMTVIYGTTWFVGRGNADSPEPIFLLMFYLFNVFSIFSYHILAIAFDQLRQAQPMLRNII